MTQTDGKGIKILKDLNGVLPDGEEKEILQDVELWSTFGREIYTALARRKFITFSDTEDYFETIYRQVYGV